MATDTKALTDAIESLLSDAGIRNIESYGWLSHNKHDPQFAGYAQWTTDPPYDLDSFGWTDDPEPPQAADKQQQQLIELGTDFFGLMKAGRYAIGAVLLHRDEMIPWSP